MHLATIPMVSKQYSWAVYLSFALQQPFLLKNVCTNLIINTLGTLALRNHYFRLGLSMPKKLVAVFTNQKCSCITPLLGIGIVTLASRIAHNYTTNLYLKAFIYGLHSAVLVRMTNSNVLKPNEIHTLRKPLDFCMSAFREPRLLDDNAKEACKVKSELVAAGALLISSFALNVKGMRGYHPLTANMLSHVFAAIMQSVSLQLFLSRCPTRGSDFDIIDAHRHR